MANITRQQLQQIIDNAPGNVSSDEIVRELQKRGNTIEGITKEKQSGIRKAGEFVASATAPIVKTAAMTLGGVNYAQKLQKPVEERQTFLFNKVMEQLQDDSISDERKQLLVEKLNAINPDIVSQVPELKEILAKTNLQILGEAGATFLNIATPGATKAVKGASIAKKVLVGADIGAAYGLAGGLEAGQTEDKELVKSAAIGGAIGGAISFVGAVISKARTSLKGAAGKQMIKATQPAKTYLVDDFFYGNENVGDKMLKDGYKGTIPQMFKQAVAKEKTAAEAINSVVSQNADKMISKKQIVSAITKDFIDDPLLDISTKQQKGIMSILARIPEKMTLPEAIDYKRKFAELVPKAYYLSTNQGTQLKGNLYKKLASEFIKATNAVAPGLQEANSSWSLARTIREITNAEAINIARSKFKGNIIGDIFQKTVGSSIIRTGVYAPTLNALSQGRITNFLGSITPEEKSALLRLLTEGQE